MGVPKTLAQKVGDLEDHVFLVDQALRGLESGTIAYLRALAAELRVLLCLSSGTEGLLWRLIDELNVGDEIELHQIGNVDPGHPLSRGLRFAFIPLCTPGKGDVRLPVSTYSFRDVIKGHEAVFVAGRGVTHEQLIKWLAQQMGSAHEDDEVNRTLAELSAILIEDVQPFFQILHSDAALALTVAERVLSKAVDQLAYKRVHAPTALAEVAALPHRLSIAGRMAVPSAAPVSLEEGTVAFLVGDETGRWADEEVGCRFPPFEAGGLRFLVTKHPNGFVELRGSGLLETDFVCCTPMPTLMANRLMVAVTWNLPEIKIYFNGVLVETILRSNRA